MQVVAIIFLCLTSSFETVSANYSHFHNENSSEIEKTVIKYACSLISAHRDFETTFHFDTTSLHLLEEILKLQNNTERSVSLILYDRKKPSKMLFRRPTVRKLIHVVLLENLNDFGLFLNETKTINVNDEVLFVLTNKTENFEFLNANLNIKVFGKVLIIYANSENVTINSICYFCAAKSKKLTELPVQLKYPLFKKLFERKSFNNFDQHTFQVGYVDYFPFIWNKRRNKTIHRTNGLHLKSTPKGIDYELINLMSQKLNFTFQLHNYANFTKMLKDLRRKELDFIIGGVTPTPDRLEMSTMTRPFIFEGYHYLYVLSKSLKEELIRVFDPFEGYLWLLVVISIFVTSAVLYALDRTQASSISCLDSFWVCLYMAVEQNVNIKQNFKIRLGPSFLIVSWLLVCFNMSTAYKSKLSSIVINPHYKEPSNLDELASSGYSFVINKEYEDVFISMLKNSSDPVVKASASLTIIKDSFCEVFSYAVENKAAILDEYTALQYDLRNQCSDEIERKRSQTENKYGTNIRITQKNLGSVGHVWLLERRAIYRLAFDEMLSKITEAGLITAWTTKFAFLRRNGTFPMSRNFNHKAAHLYSPISIHLLFSLFFIYTIGNCCSIMVFLLELYLYSKTDSSCK